MTKQHWEDVYRAGQQLNRYPYNFIVSNFFRLSSSNGNQNLKVLDLGCGAGNHTIFCAENGHKVVAVDYSTSALMHLETRLKERKLSDQVTLEQVDFQDFRVSESDFDIVIDRCATTTVGPKIAKSVFEKLRPKMSSSGVILGTFYSKRHFHRELGKFCQEDGVWSDFGPRAGKELGTICFYEHEELEDLFQDYTFLHLDRVSSQSYVGSRHLCEEWQVIVQAT